MLKPDDDGKSRSDWAGEGGTDGAEDPLPILESMLWREKLPPELLPAFIDGLMTVKPVENPQRNEQPGQLAGNRRVSKFRTEANESGKGKRNPVTFNNS